MPLKKKNQNIKMLKKFNIIEALPNVFSNYSLIIWCWCSKRMLIIVWFFFYTRVTFYCIILTINTDIYAEHKIALSSTIFLKPGVIVSMDLHLDITRSSADFNDKLLCNLTDLFKMKTVGKEFRIFYKLRIECGILQHVSLN